MDALSFDAALARMPLVAILRGVRPDEAAGIGEALVEAGLTMVEVPLNSPQPLDSIARLARALAGRALVGAGTVTRVEEVAQVAEAGARLVVSPNTNPAVIAATRARGLVSLPGCMTPSEAFAALQAGATALKLFPGELLPPAAVKALAAVLPKGARLILVGGVSPEVIGRYAGAPLAGFGLGSALYAPGLDAGKVRTRAEAFVGAMRAAGGPARPA